MLHGTAWSQSEEVGRRGLTWLCWNEGWLLEWRIRVRKEKKSRKNEEAVQEKKKKCM